MYNPRGRKTDKEHIHIHICASGVEYHTGKSLRMSKQQFTELKQKIQNFQKEKFPELSKSIVEHGKTGKPVHRNEMQVGKDLALSDTEYQIKQRTGRASDKEELIGILENYYKRAISKEDFFEKLKEHGLRIYSRSGKITGIVYGKRKYRFRRLGFWKERLEELEVGMQRGREIVKIREKKIGREFER